MRTVHRNRTAPRATAATADRRVALMNDRALAHEMSTGQQSPSVTPDGIVGREFVYHLVQGSRSFLQGGFLFDPCQEDAVLITPMNRAGGVGVTKGPMDLGGWLGGSEADRQAHAALRLLDAAYDDGRLNVSNWALSQVLSAANRMIREAGPGAISPDWAVVVPGVEVRAALAARSVDPWRGCP